MPDADVPKPRLYMECPTPKKSRFATEEAANRAAATAAFELNKTLYLYDTCPCGWIHLTSKLARTNQTPSVTPLVALDDEAFARIVQDDVKKVAHEEDSAALRHPENLQRWNLALRKFRIELEKQFVCKAGDRSPDAREWRKRALVVKLSVAAAFDECTSLVSQQRAKNGEKREALKEQRHEAGERAIDRLIRAHQAEFDEYLTEECVALGVELPKRIQRYIELRQLEDAGHPDPDQCST